MSTTNPTEFMSEWDELQIKYGNYAPRPKTVTNEELTAAAIDFAEAQNPLETKTLKELERLEDPDDELARLKAERLQELKQLKESYKFGEIVEVVRSNYIDEITNASKNGDLIILHLYNKVKVICNIINQVFLILAKKHGYAKFCKAVGTDVIEKLPDSRVPTVLIYKDGKCCNQLFGSAIWGGEKAASTETIEWVLWKLGYLRFASTEDDPRPPDCPRVEGPKRAYRRPAKFQTLSSDSSSSENESEIENTRGYSSLTMEKNLFLNKKGW